MSNSSASAGLSGASPLAAHAHSLDSFPILPRPSSISSTSPAEAAIHDRIHATPTPTPLPTLDSMTVVPLPALPMTPAATLAPAGEGPGPARGRPGRKPKYHSAEERREQNRIAQRTFRARKEMHITELSGQVEALRHELARKQAEYDAMRRLHLASLARLSTFALPVPQEQWWQGHSFPQEFHEELLRAQQNPHHIPDYQPLYPPALTRPLHLALQPAAPNFGSAPSADEEITRFLMEASRLSPETSTPALPSFPPSSMPLLSIAAGKGEAMPTPLLDSSFLHGLSPASSSSSSLEIEEEKGAVDLGMGLMPPIHFGPQGHFPVPPQCPSPESDATSPEPNPFGVAYSFGAPGPEGCSNFIYAAPMPFHPIPPTYRPHPYHRV